MATAYERARLINIARNEANELNIGAFKTNKEQVKKATTYKEKKASSTSPTRPPFVQKSKETATAALYTAHEADEKRKQEGQRQKEMSNGWRNNLGVGRRKVWGVGVPVGTVFGSGDYQR